jgi:hypothetical protein
MNLLKLIPALWLGLARLQAASVPLTNGDFESTAPPCVAPCVPAGWTAVLGFQEVTTTAHGGNDALLLDPLGIASVSGGTDGGLYQDSSSIAGATCTYTFCLWALGSGTSLDFSIEARSASNVKLAAFTYSGQHGGSPIIGTGGSWQQYCVDIDVASLPPATDHVRVYAFVNPNPSPSNPVYFLDDMTLTSSSCLSPTPTMSPSATPDLSPTDTPTATPTSSATRTPSPSPTLTVDATPGPSSTVTPVPTATPLALLLHPVNSPNPFGAGGTYIGYFLSVNADVEIRVFTVSGELVRTLPSFAGQAGYNETYYDGRNQAGNNLASGVFVYRIQARSLRGETEAVWGKMSVLR